MGKTVGKYKVLDRVGRGGMGEVYRAIQVGLEREVALKVLSEDASAKRATERFLREARLQAKLEHPNLVRVYDAGSAKDRHFFAMELVQGETISRILNQQGRPEPSFVASVARQMAAAFLYYHPQGMVHRDIKPSNMMITGDGTLKLMDFGIAIEAGGERLTRTRAVVGTARYLSPEMARGQEPTGASDVYQLGLVLYEMLTGGPPMSGPPAVAIARRAAGERTPDPRVRWPACPERLALLVNACLDPNPEDRPDSQVLHDEAEALELKLKGWVPPANPPPFVERDPDEAEIVQERASGQAEALDPGALGGSGRFSGQISQITEEVRKPRTLIYAAIVLVAGLIGRWLSVGGEYRAEQMLVRTGARGVVLSWASLRPYAARIRYGPDGVPESGWSTAAGGQEGTVHRLVLEGLEAGLRYRFHVVFPDGKHSLDYPFVAPKPFQVMHPSFAISGEDRVEWRFKTPVEVSWDMTIETADGRALTRSQAEPSTDHRVSFRMDEMTRAPRSAQVEFAAADGNLTMDFPTDVPLGLVDHVAEVLSDRSIQWNEFVNTLDQVRYESDDQGRSRGFALSEWQTELQSLVKKRLGPTGLMESWAAVAPHLRAFLESGAPFAQRRPLLNSLAYLSAIDRVYDLYSIPPFFQVLGRLSNVVVPLRRNPYAPGEAEESILEFSYKKNMLVPSNYSDRAREQINSFSTGVFPNKGDVETRLGGFLEVPRGDWKEVVLGVEARGIYDFTVALLRLHEGNQEVILPFYQEAELADRPLTNEFSALLYFRGKPIDEIFPVHQLFARVPAEFLRPGRNKVQVELISLVHHNILPSVLRKVRFLGKRR